MSTASRGRLRSARDAPAEGELSEQIARIGDVRVEQILSGSLGAPVAYDQDHDEWVVLLAGSAILEMGTETLSLQGGDWVLIPAHVPHRLLETAAGTSWLALHCDP